MPLRKIPLINGEIYHIFNRGVNFQPIFRNKWDYNRALEVLKFYLVEKPALRYGKFLLLPQKERKSILINLQKQVKLVDIICYCLMPNHFHLLIKQNKDNGISSFMRNFQISYTRYYNERSKRIGPLLQGQFKAVRMETEEQLLHVSRYIHLNPFSSFVVKQLKDSEVYPWSSYGEYLGQRTTEICQKSLIFSIIKFSGKYKEFVSDQADYQRKLDQIKHLTLD